MLVVARKEEQNSETVNPTAYALNPSEQKAEGKEARYKRLVLITSYQLHLLSYVVLILLALRIWTYKGAGIYNTSYLNL